MVILRWNLWSYEMTNEPVAIRYNFDGYGYQYMDSGSGSDWQTRVKGEPLYTHPAKTLTTKEIADVWFSLYKEAIPMMDVVILTTFGEALLRKANEK